MRKDEVKEAKKENEAAVETVKGACRFCGQIAMVEARLDYTQEEIDEVATEKCSCYQAIGYARKKHQKEKAMEQIAKQFSEMDAERRQILEILADEIIEGYIEKVSINIDGRKKCTIKMNSKDKIEIQKQITETLKMEA